MRLVNIKDYSPLYLRTKQSKIGEDEVWLNGKKIQKRSKTVRKNVKKRREKERRRKAKRGRQKRGRERESEKVKKETEYKR